MLVTWMAHCQPGRGRGVVLSWRGVVTGVSARVRVCVRVRCVSGCAQSGAFVTVSRVGDAVRGVSGKVQRVGVDDRNTREGAVANKPAG